MNSPEFPSLEEIKRLPPEEAISTLNGYLVKYPHDDEAFTLRGQKHWNLNHRKEAINDYLSAIRINPSSRAKMMLEFSNSILDYYNKDLLNP